jgi:hypothetical protein
VDLKRSRRKLLNPPPKLNARQAIICNLGIPATWLRRPSALNHRRRMRIVQTAAFAQQIASCRRGSVAAGVRHGTQWTGKRLIRRRTLAMIRVPRISPSRMDGDRALEAATKYRPPTRQRPHLGHDGPRISPARQLSWWLGGRRNLGVGFGILEVLRARAKGSRAAADEGRGFRRKSEDQPHVERWIPDVVWISSCLQGLSWREEVRQKASEPGPGTP